MRQKEQRLLEEAYQLVSSRQYVVKMLMCEGYTEQKANMLIEKSMFNKIKRLGQTALAAGMMGASAFGGEVDDKGAQSTTNNSSLVSNQDGSKVYGDEESISAVVVLKKGEKFEDAKLKAVHLIAKAIQAIGDPMEIADSVELSSVEPTPEGSILTFTQTFALNNAE